jgi:prepilin-type N-terminal cleavage/methylation domain-containing protein
MSGGRRGVSLVELVIAVALLALLGGVVLRALLVQGRHAVTVSERAAMQAGVRTGMLVVQAELRELGEDPGGPPDLVRIAADSVTFRAPRGFGLTCAVSATQVRILNSAEFPFSARSAPSRRVGTAFCCSSRGARHPHLMINGFACRSSRPALHRAAVQPPS